MYYCEQETYIENYKNTRACSLTMDTSICSTVLIKDSNLKLRYLYYSNKCILFVFYITMWRKLLINKSTYRGGFGDFEIGVQTHYKSAGNWKPYMKGTLKQYHLQVFHFLYLEDFCLVHEMILINLARKCLFFLN